MPQTPGIGFGAGLERLLLAIEREAEPAAPEALDVFLVAEPDADRATMVRLLAAIRASGRSADMDYAGRSRKGQDKLAQRLKPRVVVVVGAADARIERWGEPADYPVPLDAVVDRIHDR